MVEDEKLIIIDDVVYDVSAFAERHPGGKNYLQSYLGKDATEPFNGAVYNHSVAARHILATLRVATLQK